MLKTIRLAVIAVLRAFALPAKSRATVGDPWAGGL